MYNIVSCEDFFFSRPMGFIGFFYVFHCFFMYLFVFIHLSYFFKGGTI